MSDNESETSCENCSTCVAERKTENAFRQNYIKKTKLYSAYKSNLAHIEAQMEKIKKAERIKKRFEVALEENKEDMETLKEKCLEIYKIIDDDRNLSYSQSNKMKRIAEFTLPPPRSSDWIPTHSVPSSGAHTQQVDVPSSGAHTQHVDDPS